MNRRIAQPDVLAAVPEPPPPFTAREREALLALVDLWEATGEPQSFAQIAAHLRSPVEFVWSPINVCRKLRLVWYVWPNTAIVDGFVPLVMRELAPDARPDPPRKVGGTSKRMAERLRSERQGSLRQDDL